MLGVILLAAFYVQDSRERTAPFLFLTDWQGGTPAASRLAEEPLPVPRAAEVDLSRARALLASGHPRDALRLVERVRPVDPLRGEADALREDIQRALLAGGLAPDSQRAPRYNGSARSMKCPKCGYIGFEQTDRCRNCGYDFVLAPSAPPDPDLPLRKGDAGPFGDFDLGEAGPPAAADGSSGIAPAVRP